MWRFVPIIAVSILGALAHDNTLFALAGSLVSRQEDAAQIIVPAFIPPLGGFLVANAIAPREIALSLGLSALGVWLLIAIAGLESGVEAEPRRRSRLRRLGCRQPQCSAPAIS